MKFIVRLVAIGANIILFVWSLGMVTTAIAYWNEVDDVFIPLLVVFTPVVSLVALVANGEGGRSGTVPRATEGTATLDHPPQDT